MATTSGLGTLTQNGSSFRLSGSSSNLDTNAMVEALSQAKRLPAARLEDKIEKNSAKLTALGDLGSKLKEIKFRVNCADHDYVTKMRHAEEFLDKGNKVRVHLQFRGREMAHQELGMALMVRVKTDLVNMAQVEMEPKLMGKSVTMTLAPLPANKRKRHFLSDHDLPPLEDDEEEDDE